MAKKKKRRHLKPGDDVMVKCYILPPDARHLKREDILEGIFEGTIVCDARWLPASVGAITCSGSMATEIDLDFGDEPLLQYRVSFDETPLEILLTQKVKTYGRKPALYD